MTSTVAALLRNGVNAMAAAMMPQVDGWSVLGTLKADPEPEAVTVLMTSGVRERALSL